MQQLLARRQRHGWSWPELSRRSGLPVWKLHSWRRRLAAKKSMRRPRRPFVPVQVTSAPVATVASPLELFTSAGVRVLVPADFDAEHLRRLLRALETGC
jgi:hypothetical protein